MSAPAPIADPGPRPAALPLRPERIPAALTARDRWLLWRWTWDAGRGAWTKPPFAPGTGRLAGATDPAAWAPFALALAAYRGGGWDGLGLALAPGDRLTGIDLDGCRDPETGEIAPWAADVVADFGAYAEASPSGTGVRIWVVGSVVGLLPGGRAGTRRGPVEVYSGGRYLTATGHVLPGAPAAVRVRQAALARFVAGLVGPGAVLAAPPSAAPAAAPSLVRDDEVVARARAARNGAKFAALFDRGDTGGHGGDDSAADLALCAILAFWTRDPGQLDRIFRRSALYRAKWERPDYRDRTVARALAGAAFRDPGTPVAGARLVRALPPGRGRRPVVDLSARAGEGTARGR